MFKIHKIGFWILILGLIGCSPLRIGSQNDSSFSAWVYHDEWSDDVKFPDWDLEKRNIGVGFLRPEQRSVHPLERETTQKFQIEVSDFEIDLLLTSGRDDDASLLVSMFINYEQADFFLDSKAGSLHHVTVKPEQELEIPIKVPLSGEGWHDIFVVAYYSPDNHPEDAEARLPGSGIHLGGRRAVVCVQHCEKPQLEIDEYVGESTDATKFQAIDAMLLSVGSEEPQRRILPIATVSSNEILDVELWSRNRTETERNYVVIPVYDFMQIPFSVTGSDKMLINMPKDSDLVISGNIPAAERGFHEFLFIVIYDPFKELQGIDSLIKSEMRSGIEVIEGQ